MKNLYLLSKGSTSISNSEKDIHINADFTNAGVWSGVRSLIDEAYNYLKEKGFNDVIQKHQYELYMVLASKRKEINLTHACLTDTTEGIEKTRNFPVDRAYRIVNGLVELVGTWKEICTQKQKWRLFIHNFDMAHHLATRFYLELGRRQSHRNILILATCQDIPDQLDTWKLIDPEQLTANEHSISNQEKSPATTFNPQISMHEFEKNFMPTLEHYSQKEQHDTAAEVAIRALCLYNHYGFYHESAYFLPYVLPYFEKLVGTDQSKRWNYVGNMFQALVTTEQEDKALELINSLAAPHLTQPELQAKMHYLLAMVYIRYAKNKDLEQGERHILDAVKYVEQAKQIIPLDEYAFLKVFINNGLAFVRVRQNRPTDALELCQNGYQYLTRTLGDKKHNLHRSVLIYNSAQVYMMLNEFRLAESSYLKSIEMDPYYSEYYNELGNIYLKSQEYHKALRQYQVAIQYSAPYPEVYFNQGVCLSLLGENQQAISSFNLSADLDPSQSLLYVHRAELFEELGNQDQALQDYDKALTLAPELIIARVNKAVILFEQNNFNEALDEMNKVVSTEPQVADHLFNRSQIYQALGKNNEANMDLEMAKALADA